MEFRWLTTDEQRGRTVESGSLSDILALAQKLQAEGEGRVNEDQVVEMGRELGVRPEYIREAMRLRRRSAQPARALQTPLNLPPTDHNPIAAVAQVLLSVFALGMLPRTMLALQLSQLTPGLFVFFALIAALAAGWSARYSRLAGIAGAMAIPVVLLVASFRYYPGSVGGEAVFFSLLSLAPLGSVAGRAAARARRWAERLAARHPLIAPGH
jgi:hypothetical protein